MAVLTQLTLDADGTIDTVNVDHDAGTGSPYFSHCNDAPDGLSSDWVANDNGEASGTAFFRLTDVDADFDSMDSLNIDVDVWAETPVSDDSITLTAQIYDGNSTGTPLTNETANVATQADTTRIQRNIVFGGLTGTKTQWNNAYILFRWTYSKQGGPDNANLRLYGCDIDGAYTAATTFTPVVNAFRFYDNDAGESASTALAAQDIDVDVDAASADVIVHLRSRVDETTGGGGLSTDDWQLQSKLNAGSWLDVTGVSSNVRSPASSAAWVKKAESSFVRTAGGVAADEALPGTPAEDDIVIILCGADFAISSSQGVTEAGYTEIHRVTSGSGFELTYKIMGATPDTVVEVKANGSRDTAFIIQVWSGVDTGTPIDATMAFALDLTTGYPDPPAYTTVTANALVFATGTLDDDNDEANVVAPTGYTNLIKKEAGAIADDSCTIMMASKIKVVAGAENPSAFTGVTDDGWMAVTVGLRPAATGGSQLTDGDATTDRGTEGISNPGSGSFVAGEQESANGLIEDRQLTADNFTEHVWALELVSADLVNGNTLEFRLRLNGGAITNNVVPTITIGTGGSTDFKTISVTRTRSFSLATVPIFAKIVAVTRTRAFALVKAVAKTFAFTRTRAAVSIKKTLKTFAVTRTRSAAVAFAMLFPKLVTLTRTRTAAIVKQAGKTFTVTRTRTVALAKNTGKVIAVIRTRTAALTTVFTQVIAIAVTRTRSVVVDPATLLLKTLVFTRTRAAVVAPIPTFVQAVAVTRTRSATLVKLIKKTLTVVRTRTATLVKKTLKTFTLTRTRAAVTTVVLLAVQAVAVTRTRAVSVVNVFIAGSPVSSAFLHVWRQTKMWWHQRF